MVTKVESGRSELTINDLTPEDTGNYTCTSENTAGFNEVNGTIIVNCEYSSLLCSTTITSYKHLFCTSYLYNCLNLFYIFQFHLGSMMTTTA